MTKKQYITIATELGYDWNAIQALQKAQSLAECNQIMVTARERKMEYELRWKDTKFKPSKIGVAVYQSISALIA